MSNTVAARKNAKFDTFKLLLGPLLGRDVTETIETMVKQLTTGVQFEPLQQEHSLALSALYTNGPRLVVHAQCIDGEPRFLFRQSLPLNEKAVQLLYNTGHDSVISVSALNGHVLVYAVHKEGEMKAVRCSTGEEEEEPSAPPSVSVQRFDFSESWIADDQNIHTIFKGYVRAGEFRKMKPFKGFQIFVSRI